MKEGSHYRIGAKSRWDPKRGESRRTIADWKGEIPSQNIRRGLALKYCDGSIYKVLKKGLQRKKAHLAGADWLTICRGCRRGGDDTVIGMGVNRTSVETCSRLREEGKRCGH